MEKNDYLSTVLMYYCVDPYIVIFDYFATPLIIIILETQF